MGVLLVLLLPCGARPRKGACGARAVTAKRARSGAEGDCAAGTRSCGGRPLAGCRSVEQDGAWSRAVGLPVDGARARRSALACGTRAPTTGGAMRSADLWAARRSERPWREPPAYADRIGRSAFDSSYSRNRDRRITALSRACTCESGGNGAGTSAIDSKGESAGAGISGSTGSLGRARTFRRSG